MRAFLLFGATLGVSAMGLNSTLVDDEQQVLVEDAGRRLSVSDQFYLVLKNQPRAFAASCKVSDAIIAGTMAPLEPTSIPAYMALTSMAEKVAFLKKLPLLSKKACNQIAGGQCKDNPAYAFFGFGCADWGADYTGDGKPDCATNDVGYIYDCSGLPAPSAPLTSVTDNGQGYRCEKGGFHDSNYPGLFYPLDITVPSSPNYNTPAGQTGGMDQLRRQCPVACKFDDYCLL